MADLVGTTFSHLTSDSNQRQPPSGLIHCQSPNNNLGVIYSERKDYEAAAREYEMAISLDSRMPAAYYNFGNDLLREGEYPRAARLFSKSLRLYPTDVWALNNRGLAYMKMGKPEKARRDFEEALRIDPGFEQARRSLESAKAAGARTPGSS